MAQKHRGRQPILLYGFLALIVFRLITHNHDIVKTLRSLERSPYVTMTSSMNHNYHGCGTGSSEHILRDNSDKAETQLFRETLELRQLIGKGDVSFGFQALYQNKTVIAKIASDNDLFYSDLEIGILHELNEPPSIPNIPKLQLAIRSMPNPFVNSPSVKDNLNHLVSHLGLEKSDAEKLLMKRRISVIVMDLLKGNRAPKDLEEVQRLMKSLLETMEFVHSRNIMHCDLHLHNFHWDGDKVYLFDWNGGFRYEPNKVLIHYPRTPKQLFPPEAVSNTSAVHTSVHAFDVYTMGRIMKLLLKNCCGITFEMLKLAALDTLDERETNNSRSTVVTTEPNRTSRHTNNLEAAIAYQLAEYMMLPDPYERPTTTQALKHMFFERDLSS